MGKVEAITRYGIKFRRYPDANGWSDRSYFKPGIADRQRGIQALHQEVWKRERGPIPPGWQVHHLDGNPGNNDVDNLDCLPRSAHDHHHHDDRSESHRTPDHLAHLESIRVLAAEWHASEEGRRWHAEHGRRTWDGREPVEAICEQCGGSYTMLAGVVGRFCSNACKSAWRRASRVDDEDRTCARCGDTFRTNRYSKVRFCSRSCSARSRWDG